MTAAETPADAMHTVAEAAQRLGISESSMWVLIRNQEIETVEIPSAKGRNARSMRRVEESAIERFKAAHRTPAAS